MKGQWNSLLGLAFRAKKVVSGEELVLKELRKGRVKLVLLANDGSPNTKKKITDKCAYYQVPVVFIGSRYELGQAIGKKERVVVAVCEEGFAKKLKLLLE